MVLLSGTHLMRTFELGSLDHRFRLRGEEKAAAPVTVVFIGDDSIEALGRWPWSWDHHALLIDILTRAGARMILFDVLFTESPGAEAEGLLSLAVRASGRVYLCSYFEEVSPTAPGATPGLAGGERLHEPLPSLARAAAGVGHCVAPPDEDGSTRRYPLALLHRGRPYPSLPLLATARHLGIPPDAIAFDRPGAITLPAEAATVSVPVDAQGGTAIAFTGGMETFPAYSFREVLQADRYPGSSPLSLEVFRDRIVLVGATFTGNTDMRSTPFASAFPMMLIQASAMENILNGRFLRRPPALPFALAWVAGGTVLGGVLFALRPLVAAGAGLLSASAYLLLAVTAFTRWRIHLDLVGPLSTVALVWLAMATMRHFIEERRASQLQGIFSSYVSERVVRELLAHPEKARLGGERREVTVLFADIRGFTAFAEQNSPEEVVETLNQYFGVMTEIVLKWEGTLDKLVGDSIMAFWNAPLAQEDHAERAVRCALDMARGMEELRRSWTAAGRNPLEMGIGLNSGEVLVGNVGSERKKDYTVIGDHVNLAARVESLNKEYGSRILITEHTLARCPGLRDGTRFGHMNVGVVDAARVVVRGKSQAVSIFRLDVRPHPGGQTVA
jgi:adenylate cyclase